MESKPFFFYQLPQHKPPVFKEGKQGDIIHYGDKKKPYADYLIDLYLKSVKHNAIINGINRFVTGGGWKVIGHGLNTEQLAKANQIIMKPNPNQDLKDLSSEMERNIDIFGGVALHIIRTKNGNDIAEVYVLPWSLLRVAQIGEKDGKPEYRWVYLPNWKGVDKYEKAKDMEGFREFEEFTGAEGQKEGIYIWKYSRVLKQGELDLYPLPEYIGAIPYIEADAEVANFDINNIKNQFWGGQIVTMANVFSTEDEKDAFVNDFKTRKQGTDNAGEVMFVFTRGTDQSVEATPLQPSEIDKQMEVLNERIEKNIFMAHNFNKKLFGIDEDGNPFSRSELADIYEITYSQNIRPKQEILEEILNWVYSFSSLTFDLKLQKLPLVDLGENEEKGKVLEALNSLDPAIASKVLEHMSQAQVLSLIGLEPQATTTTTTTTELHMAHEDKILDYFERTGSNEYDVLRAYKFDEYPEVNDSYYRQYFIDVLGVDLGQLESNILSAISKNPKMTALDVSNAFDISITRAQRIITELLNAGILKGDEGNLEVSRAGERGLEDEDVILDISVRYRYAGPLDSRNRPFCRKLAEQSRAGKTWSREEIDNLKNNQEFNTDVWVYRGGFYTRKGTNDTTPFCRHHWEAVIVKTRRT